MGDYHLLFLLGDRKKNQISTKLSWFLFTGFYQIWVIFFPTRWLKLVDLNHPNLVETRFFQPELVEIVLPEINQFGSKTHLSSRYMEIVCPSFRINELRFHLTCCFFWWFRCHSNAFLCDFLTFPPHFTTYYGSMQCCCPPFLSMQLKVSVRVAYPTFYPSMHDIVSIYVCNTPPLQWADSALPGEGPGLWAVQGEAR